MKKSLDFDSPQDNLYAFAKMWSTLADEPVLSSFHGVMFANIAGRKSIPLFGYGGTGLFQAKILDNGNVRLRGKETGFFTDLVSGDILHRRDSGGYSPFRAAMGDFRRSRTPGLGLLPWLYEPGPQDVLAEGIHSRLY